MISGNYIEKGNNQFNLTPQSQINTPQQYTPSPSSINSNNNNTNYNNFISNQFYISPDTTSQSSIFQNQINQELGNLDVELIDYYNVKRNKERKDFEKQSFHALSNHMYNECRHIVIDYLGCIARTVRMNRTTLQMAISIYDRYLDAKSNIPKRLLQLVSLSAILIASKTDETEDKIPNLSELAQSSQNTYTESQISQMEIQILKTLKWDVTFVTPYHFIEFFLTIAINPLDLLHAVV
eukprot:gene1129-1434_t